MLIVLCFSRSVDPVHHGGDGKSMRQHSGAYALLTDGWLDDAVVVECPLHGGQFDVCTGKAICTPAEADLQTYPARIVDGQIEVLLPA
jgi:nitrite reductase/ring-hydroxylating ferredoxin subunit